MHAFMPIEANGLCVSKRTLSPQSIKVTGQRSTVSNGRYTPAKGTATLVSRSSPSRKRFYVGLVCENGSISIARFHTWHMTSERGGIRRT